MLIDQKSFFYNLICNQLRVSHLENKVKLDVVESEKTGNAFKEAVKKVKNGEFLKDSEFVIRFAEPITTEQSPKDDKDKEEADNEEQNNGEEIENTEEINSEEKEGGKEEVEDTEAEGNDEKEDVKDEEPTDDNTEETTDKNEDDEEKKDKKDVLKESVKVQDLSKSMSTSLKSNVKTGTKACKCGKKIVKEDDKKKKECDKIEEAETEATGEELKNKVRKAIEKAFGIKSNEGNDVELIDLPDFKEGYNIYFCKLSFKGK